jgi:uncharacterized membrane protein YraQ (UPF0718 family)
MELIIQILIATWQMLLASAFYILIGIVIAGLLKTTLNPGFIVKHLGKGRFVSVVKAAFLGVPLPL